MTSKSILFEIKPKETAIDSVLIQESQNQQYKWNIKWKTVFVFLYIHFTCIYVFVHIARLNKWTVLWYVFFFYISEFGITAGAHRLWCHRAYKAKWPLRLILLILQTVSFQGTIYHWSRDHRLHHKFTDTDADPYNARRGVFFSHMGWLMIQKHPDVKTNGALIDWSDLKRDPFVAFQIKYYSSLIFVFGIVVPTMVPWLAWNESLWYSWAGNVTRFCLSLHCTWLVNSAAHIWGMRPYDKFISPTENTIVALLAGGEGWHNYHHIFPWDYKAAELGNYSLNITTAFIDFFALLGWAYDLKTASPDIVKKRVLRNSKETK